MAYAFQCRTCGHLEEGAHAGDRAVPRGCRHCGAGVRWEIDAGNNPRLVDEPDNWTVLADLSAKEQKPILDKFRITADDIEAYTPKPSGPASRAPQHVERSAQDSLVTEDVAS